MGEAHAEALDDGAVVEADVVGEVVAVGAGLVDVEDGEVAAADGGEGRAGAGVEGVEALAVDELQEAAVAEVGAPREHPQVAAARVDVQRHRLGRGADLDLGEVGVLVVDQRVGEGGPAAEAERVQHGRGGGGRGGRLGDAHGDHALGGSRGGGDGEGQQGEAAGWPPHRGLPLLGGRHTGGLSGTAGLGLEGGARAGEGREEGRGDGREG